KADAGERLRPGGLAQMAVVVSGDDRDRYAGAKLREGLHRDRIGLAHPRAEIGDVAPRGRLLAHVHLLVEAVEALPGRRHAGEVDAIAGDDQLRVLPRDAVAQAGDDGTVLAIVEERPLRGFPVEVDVGNDVD